MAKLKVMVFGVFDLLHPGHISFLKQAKKFGDFLIVSVAQDVNVVRVKKRKPVMNEKTRLNAIKNLKIANKVVLGALKDPWPHIVKERPDLIAFGYDQRQYIKNFKSQLKKRGLKSKIVRLRPFKPEIHKSSILRKNAGRKNSRHS